METIKLISACERCGKENTRLIYTQVKLIEARHNEWEFLNMCLECVEDDIKMARKAYRTGHYLLNEAIKP